LAANLSQGELAVNTNDGKLFYKDSSGVVQTMASKATGAIGGSTTQVQFNNAGVLGGSASLTWSGTVLTSSGFAGPLNGTVGATTANTGAFTTLSASGTTTLSGNSVISVTDNTNAALRITQLGTGNALLVEDSANPDSTPFVIDATGKVVIGNTSSPTISGSPQLQLASSVTQAGANIGLSNWIAASNSGPIIQLAKSRSGAVSTQGVVSSSDFMGTFAFYGDDGVAFIQGASIAAQVDGTPGTNDMPGRLVFSTTADGASSPTERMRIDSSGNVGIGTSSPASRLHVSDAGAVNTNTFNVSTTSSTTTPITLIGANLVVDAAGTYTKPATSISGSGILFEAVNSLNAHGSIQFLSAPDTNTGSATPTERMRIDSNGTVNVSKNAKGTVTTANSGSFDMSLSNNFICTPTGGVTLTFTNITAGQSGNIVLVNGSNYAIAKASAVKVASGVLTTLSATGSYWMSYYSPDGTNVYLSTTAALS
jgi:hypothetical protein